MVLWKASWVSSSARDLFHKPSCVLMPLTYLYDKTLSSFYKVSTLPVEKKNQTKQLTTTENSILNCRVFYSFQYLIFLYLNKDGTFMGRNHFLQFPHVCIPGCRADIFCLSAKARNLQIWKQKTVSPRTESHRKILCITCFIFRTDMVPNKDTGS